MCRPTARYLDLCVGLFYETPERLALTPFSPALTYGQVAGSKRSSTSAIRASANEVPTFLDHLNLRI